MRDHFWRRLWGGTLPLIIWGLHFTACYVLFAVQCSPAAATPGAPNRLLLGGMSLAALAACAMLAWRTRATLRTAGEDTGLYEWARAGSALLALAGIAWTSLPILLLDGCA
jgi:hypothetical protein